MSKSKGVINKSAVKKKLQQELTEARRYERDTRREHQFAQQGVECIVQQIIELDKENES